MDAPFEEGLWVGVWWVLLGLDQQVRHAQLQVNLRREQGEVEIVQKNAKKKKKTNPRRKEKNPLKAEIRSKRVWEHQVVFLRALLLFLAPKLLFSLTLAPLSSSSLHRILLNFHYFLQLPTVLGMVFLCLCVSQVHFIHFCCSFPSFCVIPSETPSSL